MTTLHEIFATGTPYADTELQQIATDQGLTFSEVIPAFDYLGRYAAKEDSQVYYWYVLQGGEPC